MALSTQDHPDPPMRLSEFCRLYGISRQIARGEIQSGRLVAYDLGTRWVRIFHEDAEKWRRSTRVRPRNDALANAEAAARAHRARA